MRSLRLVVIGCAIVWASPALAVDLITVVNRTERRLTVFLRPTNAPPQKPWRRLVLEPGKSDKIGVTSEDPFTVRFYVPMSDGTVNNYGMNNLQARQLMRQPSGTSQSFDLSLELCGMYYDFQSGHWNYQELHTQNALTVGMVATTQRLEIDFGPPVEQVAPKESPLPTPTTPAPANPQ
jgi:hypothetical protein